MSAIELGIQQGREVRIRILEFITAYIKLNGWSPSYLEIAHGVGLSSRSTVMSHLYQLQQEGKIVLGGGPRMIRIVEK